mmetsp:Transcript_13956/g.28582  ORF Transcript_13956/g.28582 Transcript_13956/m.28582 type:complete len:99 (+) Transcript_13956:267-563(+)
MYHCIHFSSPRGIPNSDARRGFSVMTDRMTSTHPGPLRRDRTETFVDRQRLSQRGFSTPRSTGNEVWSSIGKPWLSALIHLSRDHKGNYSRLMARPVT